MKYWWVNQNQTYRHEVDGGYLWAPKSGVWHHETMQKVAPGDLVFSFKGAMISAVGVVQRPAQTLTKPDFGSAGANWQDIGWYVETEFMELEVPFKATDYFDAIRPLLPERYSPLQPESGRGNQIYLTEIGPQLGLLLLDISNADPIAISEEYAPSIDEDLDAAIQYEILAKKIEGDLEKIQLTKARRGQGIFRTNVRLIEKSCRLTGVSNIKHLRASHIKPWRNSSDKDKIDGNNGLLLSPHVDHLFDRGFITFKNSGDLIISKELSPAVLDKWSLGQVQNVGAFNPKQSEFMEFHRDVVFKAS